MVVVATVAIVMAEIVVEAIAVIVTAAAAIIVEAILAAPVMAKILLLKIKKGNVFTKKSCDSLQLFFANILLLL